MLDIIYIAKTILMLCYINDYKVTLLRRIQILLIKIYKIGRDTDSSFM